MLNVFWQGLIANLAIVSLVIVGWTQLQYWLEDRPRAVRRPVFALWMGLGAVASILLSLEMRPGAHFDLRVSLIALAGFFGGWPAALITAGLAMLCRFAVGGSGMVMGLIGIAMAAGLGALLHLFVRRYTPTLILITIVAVGAGLTSIAGFLMLPPARLGPALLEFGLPLATLNVAATALSALLILHSGAVRDERRLLRTAITHAPELFYVKDRDSRFVAVNTAVAQHHNRPSPSALRGKSDLDLEEPARAKELLAIERDLIDRGADLRDVEEHVLDKEGKPHWYVTSKVALTDSDGAPAGLVGITRDVTLARLRDAELKHSQELLARAMREMSDGLAMFDEEGILVFCNQQYQSLFPLTGEFRKAGVSLRDILHEVIRTQEQVGIPLDHRGDWIESVVQSLAIGGEQEVKLFNGDWLHIRTRPASDGSALVVVSDATTIKSAEDVLRGVTDQLKLLAATDSLTGLANRRALDDRLHTELARAARSGSALALLMIDVDYFKTYNDLYGHQAGDDCLVEVGRSLREISRRPTDLAARYGGEEFVVLLPDTPEDDAYRLAETLRAGIQAKAIPHAGNPKSVVTISIGVAVAMNREQGGHHILGRADAALYDAKAAGRNRVMGWRGQVLTFTR